MRHRLNLLDALLAAAERPHEVLDLVLSAADAEEATAAVAGALGTSPPAARAVLDAQWRGLTRQGLQRLHAERDDLRARAPGPVL